MMDWKDTMKVGAILCGGITLGSLLQALVDLKQINRAANEAARMQNLYQEALGTVNAYVEKHNKGVRLTNELERENNELRGINDAQTRLIIEQRKKITDLEKHLFS